jgi:N-acyl amino acid synthase of PEP-CTERM/exosortase system
MEEILGFKFLRVVDNKELLQEIFKLRYEIYCHEADFLDDTKYPDGIENDIYDEHSIHFAALDKMNQVVGTLRLIFDSEHGFPLEQHCPNYDKSKITFPRSQLAEISRLAVSKSWRRRKNDGLYGMTSYHSSPDNEIPEHIAQKRKRPIIVFGLYKQLYIESKRRGITHWYAAMEQKLNNSLSKFEFEFDPIGPEHDYYGPVTPFLGIISNIEKRIYHKRADVAHLMVHGLEPRLMPKFGFAFPVRNYFVIKYAKLRGKI